ncbi:MAG: alpha/beta fold hydrolase [Betaproteobacteria bacterium]|nr:alpha/beta fold hydrolase [Betaproteobacteria bacterium]
MTTLVFVHGFTCDGSDWAAQLSFFGRQCPVLALDLPGHGNTPADKRWTLEALVKKCARRPASRGPGSGA